jgi:hypothetical protein
MKKIFLLIFSILLAYFGVTAQALVKKMPLKSATIVCDRIGNLYALTGGQKLTVYSPDGDSLYSFTNNANGKMQPPDVTNPLKILLFYPDYSIITVLDRTLNPSFTLDGLQQGLNPFSTAAMSEQNTLWAFDMNDNMLRNFDEYGKVINSSPSFSMLTDSLFVPTCIRCSGNRVYVGEAKSGIWVFDNYGNFMRRISHIHTSVFEIYGQLIVYRQGQTIMTFDMQTLEQKSYALPNTDEPLVSVAIAVQQGRLWLATASGLFLFKI